MNRTLKIVLLTCLLLGGMAAHEPADADLCERNPSLCQ